jgi:hypothetical protein
MRSVLLIVALGAAASVDAAAPPAPWKLTAEDRQFLDGLTFLVDPRGGERVSVPVLEHRMLPLSHLVDQPAWRFPSGDRKPAKLLGTAGESLLPRGGVKRLDFLAECRAVLREEPLRSIQTQFVALTLDNPDLELAVWCRRLGHEELAAHFLSRIEDRREAVKDLREALAWRSYEAAINAYRDHSDAEALARVERHLRLYPDVERYRESAETLLKELRRRPKAGGLRGRQPVHPGGFERWPVARRVAFLVTSLEDADAVEFGGILDLKAVQHFSSDPRVSALIKLGDAAVPALLDTVELDTRLTRAAARGGVFARDYTLLPVRKAAAQAILAIIGSRAFLGEPEFDEDAENAAQRLRAYWKRYGHLGRERRLLAHLTDATASSQVWEEAATELAHVGCVWVGRRRWEYQVGRWVHKHPNPALNLVRPTVAEAILAAMDRAVVKGADSDSEDRAVYLDALADLGDPRALPLLHARLKAAEGVERCQLADCCRRLGSSGPIDHYAKDIEAGRVVLLSGGRGTWELLPAVRALISARRPTCDRALYAVTRPGRAIRGVIRDYLLNGDWPRFDEPITHPFLVPLLAAEVGDTTPTGVTLSVDGDMIEMARPDVVSSDDLPAELSDPANRLDTVMERRGDRAATLLSEMIAGFPFYHPLLRNRAATQVVLNGMLARYEGRFRLTTEYEAAALNVREAILPDIRPLGRAATAADVKAGRAVFHLPAGKPLTIKLPAVAELKGEKGIIVQAESGADSKTVYGVILRRAIRRVEAKDVLRVAPLPD